MPQPTPATDRSRLKRAVPSRALLTVHRRVGIISAVFVILLSISGFLLQHSAGLGFDRASIASDGLLDWYGIKAPGIGPHFQPGSHYFSHIGDAVYFDAQRLPGSYPELRGVVAFDQGFALTTDSAIVLITVEGDVIERLSAEHGVPELIQRIGTGPDARVFLNSDMEIREANFDAPSFTPVTASDMPAIDWSQASEPAATLAAAVERDYAGSLVTWERVLLDIHSGRLLGAVGVFIVDLMAVLFLLMAISGVWIWTRRRN